MKRLSGMDAAFLYGETPAVHMHTLKVAIVDAPQGDSNFLFSRLKHELTKRLHLMPLFKCKAVNVPLGLHHPIWADDPEFDISRHVRRLAVVAPGGQRELDDTIAQIAGRPLRRDRPLWEVWMLEGLPGNEIAYVAKIHHAIADGLASSTLLNQVMDPADGSSRVTPFPAPPKEPSSTPSPTKLAWNALKQTPARAAGLPSLMSRTLQGARRLIRHHRRDGDRLPGPFATEKTVLNTSIGPRRSFATTSIEFERLRVIKSFLNVTVNDVVLALVSGALRDFLNTYDMCPEKPLIATVPVSIALNHGDMHTQGNKLSSLFTSLCTNIECPLERIRAIHLASVSAKKASDCMGTEILHEWAEYIPPVPYKAGLRLYSDLKLANRHRPPANVIVSNVRGPDNMLTVGGRKLKRFYSVGPILGGMGLNLTAWSYAGQLNVTALGNHHTLPHIHEITNRLEYALQDLEQAIARAKAA
jgi:diacylglycerol O-acyltransferase / wax synthase